MIRIQVTNNDVKSRTWNVEPYGDEVQLEINDVLSIEIAADTSLMIEVTLHTGAEVIWAFSDSDNTQGTVLLPADLKLNGLSLWGPATDGEDSTR